MRTFGDFEATKARLLRSCDDVEHIAQEMRRTATALTDTSPSGTSTDGVAHLLADARNRLTRTSIEVGVFGQIKRGKSTLVNALLGREVSSMRVTPETAVPVWIDGNSGPAEILLADGTCIEVTDAKRASEMATQAERRKRKGADEVVRVVQHVDVPWLRTGVRLIDTPGLSDPALADELEDLTLSELDRVAVAIVVFCQPPGIDREEVSLLRSLAGRSIDKLFLVCNFHTDVWTEPEDRQQTLDYITSIVRSAGTEGIEQTVRLYPVNARLALRAALSGDDNGYNDSGVASLRNDIEDYLTTGAIQRVTQLAGTRVRDAAQMIRTRLDARLDVLTNPTKLETQLAEIDSRIASARRRLDAVAVHARKSQSDLTSRLSTLVVEPFRQAASELDDVSTVHDLELLTERLRIRSETATSRATLDFRDALDDLEERVQRELSISGSDADADIAGNARLARLGGIDSPLTLTVSRDPMRTAGVALTTAATVGTGLGLLGGTLAGGAGLALLAMGPVGWLIGAGIGAVLGGVLGGSGAILVRSNRVPTEAKQKIRVELDGRRAEATSRVEQSVRSVFDNVERNIHGLLDLVVADEMTERRQLKSFIDDTSGRLERERTTRELLERINRVIGDRA